MGDGRSARWRSGRNRAVPDRAPVESERQVLDEAVAEWPSPLLGPATTCKGCLDASHGSRHAPGATAEDPSAGSRLGPETDRVEKAHLEHREPNHVVEAFWTSVPDYAPLSQLRGLSAFRRSSRLRRVTFQPVGRVVRA